MGLIVGIIGILIVVGLWSGFAMSFVVLKWIITVWAILWIISVVASGLDIDSWWGKK